MVSISLTVMEMVSSFLSRVVRRGKKDSDWRAHVSRPSTDDGVRVKSRLAGATTHATMLLELHPPFPPQKVPWEVGRK